MKLITALLLTAAIAAAQQGHEKKEPAQSPAPAENPAAAADHAGGGEHGGGEKKEGPSELWKWANFALLAGGLGYLIGKNAGPFFAARTQQIKKDMLESAAARKEAEARAAEVDRRLASIESEIASLRAESQK